MVGQFPGKRWALGALCAIGAFAALLALRAAVARAAFPGANGKIAYLALTPDPNDSKSAQLEVWTINADRSDATQLTHDETSNADHPVFSPDGTKIAYEQDGGHIWVMNADGSNQVDLTPGDHSDITYDRPAWSPDGTKLAVLYRNQQDTTPEYDVAVISASTASSSVTNLTAGAGVDSGDPSTGGGPAWSPDGSKIAFVRGDPREIWVMNATNGANPHAITDTSDDALNPAWSPDGSKIVFDTDGQLYTTNPSAASPGQTQLTTSMAQGNRAAEFSPDGTKIVEQGTQISTGAIDISILNANGTGPTSLTAGPSFLGAHYVDEPDWQPTTADHLTVTPAGSGAGTVVSSPAGISCPGTCTFPYGPSTKVTLTATPSAGSYFAGWSGGGCSGAGTTCTITLATDTTVTATFNPGYLLTVKPSPDLTMEIKSVPAGIDCEKGSTGTCSATFAPNSFVTLSENTYQDGALFTGWTGGGCSGIGACTLRMSGPETVTGSWTYIPPQQSGSTVATPLAFTDTQDGSYVGTEWTGFLTSVDCPGSGLCVAAGYMTDSATIAHKGIVSTDTNLSSATGGWGAGVPDSDFNWAPPGDQWQLEDISCAGTSFCGAVDDQGDVFTTTNPYKGADSFGPNPQGVWQKTQNLDPIGNYSYHYTVGISCPASGECGVIDADGGLLTSTNTAGGAGTWSRQGLPSQGSPGSISCPSPSSCYISTATGDVLKSITSSATSTSALQGPWTAMAVDPGGELRHLDCVQGDCFATDLSGDVWSSTHPDGGPSAWKHVHISNQLLTGIGCSSLPVCVAVDNAGNAYVSKNPTGSASDWSMGSVAQYDGLNAVSCTSALVHNEGTQTWCVAIAYDGELVEGTIPLLAVSRQGSGSGTVSSSTSLSCPSTCSTLVPAGTTVTLTATPDGNSAFSAWSSACSGTQSAPLSCTVKLDHPFTTTVDAIFSPTPVSTGGGITLGGGTGTVTLKCTSKVLCSGNAVLTMPSPKPARDANASKKPAKAIVLGTASFKIKPHKRGKIKIHLTATGKRLAKHHKLHTVRLTMTTRQAHHKRLITVRTLKVRY